MENYTDEEIEFLCEVGKRAFKKESDAQFLENFMKAAKEEKIRSKKKSTPLLSSLMKRI